MKGNHKHGHAKKGESVSPTYKSWLKMKERCSNPKDISFRNYGGRGIGYDPSWNDFSVFLRDMGERPVGYSLDRLDVDKAYGPANCKWSSRKEQANNKRTNVMLTVDGVTKTMTEWSEATGVKVGTIWRRFSVGYSSEDCIYKGSFQKGSTSHVKN